MLGSLNLPTIQVSSLLISLPERFYWIGILAFPLLAVQLVHGACDDEQGSDVYSVVDHC